MATPPGVLAGGRLARVRIGGGEFRWYQIYEMPPGSSQFVSYQFDDLEQVKAANGGEVPFFRTWTPDFFNKSVVAEAAAEEVIGLGGNWTALFNEIASEAAQAAGIKDPGLAGRIASDPEMQKIFGLATIGDWTPEQVKAAQRDTKFWKDTLYPGIQAFYGQTSDPEGAWVNYNSNVSPALTALGYKKDADGTFNTNIKKMLNGGIDAQVFLENAPIFMQATQNSQFFDVLKQRAKKELGKNIGFGDWFALLKGEAAPEIQQVAEGAVVAYQAQQAGVSLGESMLQRLVTQTDLTEAGARNVFTEVNQAVLALGNTGLQRGGLSRDDVVSAMANIKGVSGLNPEEVRLRVAKLAQENALFDDEKIQFYTGFDASGRPSKPGLASLTPEGA
jgi:hypothetical protein